MQQKIEPHSDREEREINEGIARDPDNPEWGEADFARARPSQRRTETAVAGETVEVTLDLDYEVVRHFQRQGRDWRSRINAILRHTIER